MNGIAPGVIDTPMWEQVDALFAQLREPAARREEAARGRGGAARPHGRARDLTGAALFLASADADYITAQTLNVDGGNWMS